MKDLKPGTAISDHIKRLSERDMIIEKSDADYWFSYVSYYRLSGYSYPRWNSKLDKFEPPLDFKDVVSLYEADRKLRALVYDGLERVEIAMRARLIENFSLKDAMWHKNRSNFRDTFRYDEWLKTVEKRVNRSKSYNDSIKHYESEYGEYPFWVLSEVLDFADISKVYAGLKSEMQRKIAEDFRLEINLGMLSNNQAKSVKKNHPLARWLHQMTDIRNICAHHSRLWNRNFVIASTIPFRTNKGLMALPENESLHIYGALVLISYMLQVISPGTVWGRKVADLIKDDFLTNPIVKKKSMGIPENWDGNL